MTRAVLLFLLLGIAPAGACEVVPRTVVPLDMIGGRLLVTAVINGQPAPLILDTGAERSVVSVVAVRRLGLALDPWAGTTTQGIGGIERHQNALPRSFSLGGVALRHPTLLHDSSLAVAPLSPAALGGQVADGLLGRDFLSAFDLAIDGPAHRLTLYQVRGCSGDFLPDFPPWHGSFDAVPAMRRFGNALAFGVMLDGHALRAMLDTGSTVSMVTAPGSARLGLTAAGLSHDPGGEAIGLGRNSVAIHVHRFAALEIAGRVMRAPALAVAPMRTVPIVDLLLGSDWLRSRPVWLSYATMQIFIERLSPSGDRG